MKHRSVGIIAAAALIVVMLAFKSLILTPPAVPAQIAASAFDANRAHARLVRILGDGAPHPVDTAANDAVRTRIVAELRAEGLAPRVTDDRICNGRDGSRAVSCARVRNIVAEIGPTRGPALLLVAHYDSTPVGPGASDDGIGYVSLIEVAHQLRGTMPARGITILLTDGEEAGLLGARAFLARDPAAARVTHLINLESRGVSGPAFMFETSRPNAAPIAALRATATRPVANSLSTDFYRLIPNSTDVAVFEARPWAILNFAVIGNETRYHSPGDGAAALDRRSVAHMGAQVLALTRDWAKGTQHAGGGTVIYADVLTFGMIALPLAVGLVVLALLIIGFAWAAWRSGGMLRGLAVPVAATVGALAVGWLGDLIARTVVTGEYWRGHPHVAALAVDIGAVAAAIVALLWIGHRLDRRQARFGAWLFVLLLGALATWAAPGASIFFLIPPAVVLLGVALGTRWPIAERAAAIVGALLQLAVFAQLIAEVELLLVSGPVWVTAAVTVIAALPLLVEVRGTRAPTLGLAGAVAGVAVVVGWAAVLVTPRSTPDRKARFVIEHIADANAGSARWGLATDGVAPPAPFTAMGAWSEVEVPYSGRERWVIRAPDLPLPALDVSGLRIAGDRAQFRVTAPGATTVLIQLPPDTGLTGIGLAGAVSPIDAKPSYAPFALRCTGRSCDGAVVEVVRRGTTPLVVTMTAMYPGLPAEAKPLLAARPTDAAAQYTPDARYVIKRVRL